MSKNDACLEFVLEQIHVRVFKQSSSIVDMSSPELARTYCTRAVFDWNERQAVMNGEHTFVRTPFMIYVCCKVNFLSCAVINIRSLRRINLWRLTFEETLQSLTWTCSRTHLLLQMHSHWIAVEKDMFLMLWLNSRKQALPISFVNVNWCLGVKCHGISTWPRFKLNWFRYLLFVNWKICSNVWMILLLRNLSDIVT